MFILRKGVRQERKPELAHQPGALEEEEEELLQEEESGIDCLEDFSALSNILNDVQREQQTGRVMLIFWERYQERQLKGQSCENQCAF